MQIKETTSTETQVSIRGEHTFEDGTKVSFEMVRGTIWRQWGAPEYYLKHAYEKSERLIFDWLERQG